MKDPRFHALLLTLIILLAASAGGTQNANPAPSSIYLFASFRGNGDGLHLAWSTDGLKWTALADDRILLQPTVGGKLLRDRYIVYYDMYQARKYGAMQSSDLKKWEDISAQLSLPAGTKHGTAFAVSRDIMTALLASSGQTAAPTVADAQAGKVAAKPLFRDPVYDGAADPVVVWNRAEKKWFMFYTNRRANASAAETPGVTWVHGTRIGIAQSSDGGATWSYRGTADIRYGEGELTRWAPEVVYDGSTYHMFLTLVPGVFTDWNHPRDIIHLTSADLLTWNHGSTLKLSSDRVIDACAYHLPDGTWRLWYNNERDRKSIYYADSRDLMTWVDRGKVTGVGERPGEGPKVFHWKGYYWMVVDIWQGLGVYRSDDATHWTVQDGNLVETPGKGADDEVKGGHPDVVVSGDRAFLFYFTHPGRRGADAKKDGYEQRRSSIQVVELEYKNGWLTCDRDAPTHILLQPPK